jgi:hypothetical protein
MENGCKYNEGTSALHDTMSVIFESECAVKQTHENQQIFWETNYAYCLNKFSKQTTQNNHMINRGKHKMKEYNLIITEAEM